MEGNGEIKGDYYKKLFIIVFYYFRVLSEHKKVRTHENNYFF